MHQLYTTSPYMPSTDPSNTSSQHTLYIHPLNTRSPYTSLPYQTPHQHTYLILPYLTLPFPINSQSTQQQHPLSLDESTKSAAPDPSTPSAGDGSPGFQGDKMNSSGVVQRGSRLRNEGRCIVLVRAPIPLSYSLLLPPCPVPLSKPLFPTITHIYQPSFTQS